MYKYMSTKDRQYQACIKHEAK